MKSLVLVPILLAMVACAPARDDTYTGNGTVTPQDAGSAADAGTMTPDGGACTYDAGPSGLGCGKFVQCAQGCGSDPCCQSACFNDATPAAQGLANTLNDCLNQSCPTTDGGPCAPGSSSCTGCQASASFQACGNQFSACNNDTSGVDAGE